jgi:hypothetical protein
MNSQLIRNIVSNLAVAALVVATFSSLNLSAEMLLSLFAATGLVAVVARDYRARPAAFAVAPARRPAIHSIARRRVPALVAA